MYSFLTEKKVNKNYVYKKPDDSITVCDECKSGYYRHSSRM